MKASETLPLPDLPAGCAGIPKGSRYKQQWGIIILVASEAAQIAEFEKLTALGYRCKVVCT